MQRTIADHIEITQGVCGGRPRIAGHRIRVQDIAQWHEKEGFSPDEIVGRFPQLTLSDVYAALAYYHDHQNDIQRQIQHDDSFVEAMKSSQPSKLAQKLAARGDDGNSLPPG